MFPAAAVLALATLGLSACRRPASPDSAPASIPETTSSTPPAPAAPGPSAPAASPVAVPGTFHGVWDESADACAASFSMTRFTVTPARIRWFGGTGRVTAVRGTGRRVGVDLAYTAEGAADAAAPVTTDLALDGAGRLSLGLGGGRRGLVRCPDGTDAGYGSADGSGGGALPPAPGGDLTVTLRFAPGRTSATLGDTLRAAALHDYLVGAQAGQRLTATLHASGPGAPVVLVIREATYRSRMGAFETVAPQRQGDAGGDYVWAGALPARGTYRVRVAHTGPSANAGTVSPYRLTVQVD